jgi:hypothetical protein
MTDEERKLITQRDMELINAHVDELIREAEDLDRYQAPIDFDPPALDRETWELLVKVPLDPEDIVP